MLIIKHNTQANIMQLYEFEKIKIPEDEEEKTTVIENLLVWCLHCAVPESIFYGGCCNVR